MTISTVTPLPAAPNRATQSPAAFATSADSFVAGMKTLGDELAVTIPEMNVDIAAAVAAGAAASASATAADASADAAQAAYAALVVGDASASSGTSSTSTAIGTGAKSFTATTGRLWYVGMALILRSAANAANYMQGLVTAYNVTTGALDVNVLTTSGAGTLADWQIFPVAAAGSGGWTQISSTLNTNSGSSWSFTSIPATYSDLRVALLGMSYTGGGGANSLYFDLSDNGVNWSTTDVLYIPTATGFNASDTVYGSIEVPGYRLGAGSTKAQASHLANRGAYAATGLSILDASWRFDAPISAIRVRWGDGSGDGGALKLYGR